jgi:hypothetical protein
VQPCTQEETIKEIKTSISDLVTELRGVMNEMRATLVEDREHRTRIQHLEKSQDVVFKRLRQIEDERMTSTDRAVAQLKEWQDRIQGGLKVIVAIPVVCSIISAVAALISLTR